MLDRLEREGGRLTDSRMMSTLDAQVAQIERLLARRPDVESIFVDYASVLADPAGETRRIADFLGGGLDVEAMIEGIDATLRNQGSDRGAAASE